MSELSDVARVLQLCFSGALRPPLAGMALDMPDGIPVVRARSTDALEFLARLRIEEVTVCSLDSVAVRGASPIRLADLVMRALDDGAARLRGKLLSGLIAGAGEAPLRFSADPARDLAIRRHLAAQLAPESPDVASPPLAPPPRPAPAGAEPLVSRSLSALSDLGETLLERYPGEPAELAAAAIERGAELGLVYRSGDVAGAELLVPRERQAMLGFDRPPSGLDRLVVRVLYAIAPEGSDREVARRIADRIFAEDGPGEWWTVGEAVHYLRDDGLTRTLRRDGARWVVLRSLYFHRQVAS